MLQLAVGSRGPGEGKEPGVGPGGGPGVDGTGGGSRSGARKGGGGPASDGRFRDEARWGPARDSRWREQEVAGKVPPRNPRNGGFEGTGQKWALLYLKATGGAKSGDFR